VNNPSNWLYEAELHCATNGKLALIKISFPVKEPIPDKVKKLFPDGYEEHLSEIEKTEGLNYWKCDYVVDFGGDKITNDVVGDNSLLAIDSAVQAIRFNLKKHGDEWIDQNGLPDWILFPKPITIGWGKEFYDEAVAKVEEMERKKNAEIEQRRRKP